jgi:hypothetical protein
MHLLLHAGFLPATGAEHYFFTLTENDATAFIKGIRRPHKRYVSRVEMEVVLVMEAAVFHQDIVAHPAIDLIRWDDSNVWAEVFRTSEVNGRIWSAVVIFSHAEHSSGYWGCTAGIPETSPDLNLHKTLSMTPHR